MYRLLPFLRRPLLSPAMPPKSGGSFAPGTLRQLSLERMRAAIISGARPSGERLVERRLSDELGVSRTVVRETMRHLESEGLIETPPNEGPVVARIDWPRARQIYAIRRRLEAPAAAACARVADGPLKRRLAAALQVVETGVQLGDLPFLLNAVSRFYEEIYMAADEAVAFEIVQRLNGRIARLRAPTLVEAGHPGPGVRLLAPILAAIQANDPAAAGAAVEALIDRSTALAEAWLAAQSPEA